MFQDDLEQSSEKEEEVMPQKPLGQTKLPGQLENVRTGKSLKLFEKLVAIRNTAQDVATERRPASPSASVLEEELEVTIFQTWNNSCLEEISKVHDHVQVCLDVDLRHFFFRLTA